MRIFSQVTPSFLLLLFVQFGIAAEVQVTAVDRPSAAEANKFYLSNRAPLQPSALVKLPIGAIQPDGWLLEYLRRQRDGLTGHLGEISAWLQKNDNAWLSPEGKGSWGWEEVPYWLKGFGDLGYLLHDERIIAETKHWIEGTLQSQRPNGDFGPDHRFPTGKRDHWANMIMLFCLQSYYEYSSDQRVIDLMTRYFRYQLSVPDDALLSGYWDKMRGGDNLYSVYWLYNRTGEEFLLELATKVHRNTANWKMPGTLPNWHNVNVAQCFREPAVYYLQSRDPSDLQAAYDNFHVIRQRYGQMPGGMFAADEIARPGFDDPHQCVETCGMVEQMLSDELLLAICGDPFWADQCEDVAFNSYPAAFMPDFKAFRYLTGANQVTSDSQDHSPGVMNGGPFFMMNPFSNRCCQHNHSHGWPYYAEHLWFATPDNGLAALLYSAGTVTAKVGQGSAVSIQAKTHYPFDDTIELTVQATEPAAFPLYLRVPGWCHRPSLSLNGEEIGVEAGPRQYLRLDRQWRDNDTIRLRLPMDVQVRRWEKNHRSVSIDRGPITYSLKIGQKQVQRSSKETALPGSKWRDDVDISRWPSWELQPSTPWNYGLVLAEDDPARSFAVTKRDWPADNMPFAPDAAPVELTAKARIIPGWRLDQHKLAGALQDSPVQSSQRTETVTLIPMGAARLRISAFPVIGDGPDARPWADSAE